MNDFMSEEYVTKNIRVMPMSGLSMDNTSEHTSKYYASGMGGAADSEADDAKHNREQYHYILETRHTVKEKLKEEQRKAAEQAEREAKARQK